ncbi:MFS transporter [candidate division KSB1 bacterium]|nr:MFS transporter [candidate division KSB1 bacterium]
MNPPEKNEGLKRLLRALRYRNYRLFFMGQGISLIGTWMQNIAMGWLVYRLTNSGFLLGLISFSQSIPSFFLGPFAGVVVDRLNRRNLLILLQLLLMVQAIVLGILVIGNHIGVSSLIILSTFSGMVNAFDAPARQSFVLDLVERKEDLGNAIALNSSMFNGARLIGPSIAGFLIKAIGEGWCFIINGISFLAAVVALVLMHFKQQKLKNKSNHFYEELKEGVKYSFEFTPIRTILIYTSIVSFVAMPYAVLLPIYAKDVIHGGPETLGFLMGAIGVGALVGAFFLASRHNINGTGQIISLGGTIFSIGLLVFSFSQHFYFSLTLLLFCGFGMMTQMASSNTVLQSIADDDKRGRVISFYTMSFLAFSPFGSLIAGTMASRYGAQRTLLLGAIICLVSVALFSRILCQLKKKGYAMTVQQILYGRQLF